ncbi:hypothetical protein VTK73DRAFT_283 [Phialemonium thermophilum]|uniref:Uncharacterized protein n=1 Tax=Phialemonium thermophilum TaxID=223376 RepID=A0ABR3VVZ1_9PEZI
MNMSLPCGSHTRRASRGTSVSSSRPSRRGEDAGGGEPGGDDDAAASREVPRDPVAVVLEALWMMREDGTGRRDGPTTTTARGGEAAVRGDAVADAVGAGGGAVALDLARLAHVAGIGHPGADGRQKWLWVRLHAEAGEERSGVGESRQTDGHCQGWVRSSGVYVKCDTDWMHAVWPVLRQCNTRMPETPSTRARPSWRATSRGSTHQMEGNLIILTLLSPCAHDSRIQGAWLDHLFLALADYTNDGTRPIGSSISSVVVEEGRCSLGGSRIHGQWRPAQVVCGWMLAGGSGPARVDQLAWPDRPGCAGRNETAFHLQAHGSQSVQCDHVT